MLENLVITGCCYFMNWSYYINVSLNVVSLLAQLFRVWLLQENPVLLSFWQHLVLKMFIYVTLAIGYTAYTVLNLKFILIYTFTFLFYVRFQMKDYWLDPPTEQVKYIAIICLKKKKLFTCNYRGIQGTWQTTTNG